VEGHFTTFTCCAHLQQKIEGRQSTAKPQQEGKRRREEAERGEREKHKKTERS
jgi:hypothetical protein